MDEPVKLEGNNKYSEFETGDRAAQKTIKRIEKEERKEWNTTNDLNQEKSNEDNGLERRSSRRRKRRNNTYSNERSLYEISNREMEMIATAQKNSLIDQDAKKDVLDDLGDLHTVYPTEEEFKDPFQFIEGVYKEALSSGINHGGVKIVPPKSWNPKWSFDPGQQKIITRL